MKKLAGIACALAVVGLSALPARAADLEIQSFDWSGFYAGAAFGYDWGKSRTYDRIGGTILHGTAKVDPDGLFGGLYAGYNWRAADRLILGLDADINYGGIKGSAVTDDFATFIHSGKLDWFGAGRVRAGMAFDRLLPYVAGGIAVGDYSVRLAHDTDISNNSDTLVGWTLGAGADYALSERAVLRLEYRYTDYGTLKDTFDNFPNEQIRAKLTTSDIRLGVSWKF
ncbi:MAG TPA: porin family protein [Aestuariivirga sp.]|nr:porin family protein [Aestuariivirga sp.]